MLVEAERLTGWLERFEQRHGGLRVVSVDAGQVRVVGADGVTADLAVPFPPLAGWVGDDATAAASGGEGVAGEVRAGAAGADAVARLAAHVRVERVVGLLLLRRGGWAVGVAQGRALAASKVGRAYVQGRTAAGGWSQQRYARRRAGQTAGLVSAAVAAAAEVLAGVPRAGAHAAGGGPAGPSGLDAGVTGGDRPLLRTALTDPRLRALRPLVTTRILDVPDPRHDVLVAAVAQARGVLVTLR